VYRLCAQDGSGFQRDNENGDFAGGDEGDVVGEVVAFFAGIDDQRWAR
jgi:hypothetical protein